ncbi:ribonuclease M5 [Lactococcus allomyrinae]|uniref:Ribonuclease M5 n=1 Tax=Lactococcus allomyrinae TaxID=2419773 RepID=A0A387B7S8_9LACT|nr:ribonuclease M5 [Lactococcus allomyrinae]AYF99732.1 ribonuclease M5 [Lactococcus allomyrinae]
MIEKQRINKVIVVEGRDDTANLKRYFDCDTYETGGSSIDEEDVERLKKLHEKRGIVVFTDPDFQGERIRKIIMQAIPTAEHAFLNRDEARPKGKGSLGVEHAKFDNLQKALTGVLGGKSLLTENLSALTQIDLMKFGLVMGVASRRRREFLCEQLRIGYANGKQLLKRLNMFDISFEEVEKVMNGFDETIK